MSETWVILGFGLTILINVGAIAFGAGAISKSVEKICEDIKGERAAREKLEKEIKDTINQHEMVCHADMGAMHTKVNNVTGRVCALEAGLKSSPINIEVRE